MLLKEPKLDPRVKRTRQLLQNALTELFHEKEFQDITVQDIAARAEVNRATFYAHFEDKYALLNYSMQEAFHERLNKRLAGEPGFTPDNVLVLTRMTFEFLGESIGHCKPGTPASEMGTMARPMQACIYDVLLEWLKSGRERTDPPAEIIAQVVSWTIFGSALQWIFEKRRGSPEQTVHQVFALLENGLQSVWQTPVQVG